MQAVIAWADRTPLRRVWRDGGALLLLALLTAVFFWPVLFQGAWLPQGGGDNVSFLYPMYRFIAQSMRSGEIPLWNPHQYAGFPLIADNQNGMFYPVNVALFAAWPMFSYAALQGLVIGHVFLAGAGMYACARGWRGWGQIRIRPIPALIAAVAFMFSDLFVTHIGNYNLVAVAAWLPLIFLTFHRAIALAPPQRATGSRRRPLIWSLLCGALIGVSTLAGHGQMTFFNALLLGVYALYVALTQRTARPFAWLALAGVVGVGVSAVNVLPALALQGETVRGAFSYAQSVNYSLPWQGLVGIAAPGFFGRGALAFWGDWPRVEYGYLGVLPLLLAAVAVLWYRSRANAFFAVGAVFFLLLALGENTPVHRLIFEPLALPFQVPARFVVLVNFCVAMLAAVGANGLMNRAPDRDPDTEQRHSRMWIGVGVALFVVAALLGWLTTRYDGPPAQMQQAVLGFAVAAALGWWLIWLRLVGWMPVLLFGGLALVLVSAELITNGQRVEIDWNEPTTGYQNPLARSYLQQNAGLNRIDAASGAWQAGTAQMAGLYDIGGVFNPLQLASYDVYMQSLGYRGSPPYNLLGAKYVVGDKTEPPGDTAFLIPVYADDPNVDIYLNTRALPRFQMVYRADVLDNPQAVFDAVHAPDFAPDTVVYLEAGVPLAGDPAAHRIDVIDYGLNQAVFDVQTDAPGYFVVSDIFYPHWQATVDGESAEILEANTAFRAIYLDPGDHRVVMQFRPPVWSIALTVSVLTLAVLSLAGVILYRHRPHAPIQHTKSHAS